MQVGHSHIPSLAHEASVYNCELLLWSDSALALPYALVDQHRLHSCLQICCLPRLPGTLQEGPAAQVCWDTQGFLSPWPPFHLG